MGNNLQILIFKPLLEFSLSVAKVATRIQQIKCIQGIYKRVGPSLLLIVEVSIKYCRDAPNGGHAINFLVS